MQEEIYQISVVIPFYNEEENVAEMIEAVHRGLEASPYPWEAILVDDGSRDSTYARLLEMPEKYGSHLRVVGLQRNFGQTAAMQAGIDHTGGDLVVTMDGDLQNDPADILRLVDKLLRQDLDLVVGWRKDRKDDGLRKFFSRVANRLIGRVTGIYLRDYGCSLKVYRSELIKSVVLYGEMHRFIPGWLATVTSPDRIGEEIVNHHPRTRGKSKYGLSRTFRVVIDLLSMYFFLRYSARPGHFFGVLGIASGGLGLIVLGYLFVLKLLGEDIGNRPLLMAGILLTIMSVQFILTGVQTEMIARIYYGTKVGKSYIVRLRSGVQLNQANWKSSQPLAEDERLSTKVTPP